MERREFVAAITAFSLMPTSVQALIKFPSLDESIEDWLIGNGYDESVARVYHNDLIQYSYENREKETSIILRFFSPDVIRDIFQKTQSHEYLVKETNILKRVPKFTIEAMKMPADIIERGDKSIAITAITRKLRARWSPELSQDLQEYGTDDSERDLQNILIEQIAIDIAVEMNRDKNKINYEDELVFCPYVMPYVTRKGCMMRYAKVVFPKNDEPYMVGEEG